MLSRIFGIEKLCKKTNEATIENDLYESMMYHYLHYEGQMWSRTQIIIAIEGAALTLYVSKPDLDFTYFAIAAANVVLWAIILLIHRDRENRDVNKMLMDKISAANLKNYGIDGQIWLRSVVRNKSLKGTLVLDIILYSFLVLNFFLLLIWVLRIFIF